MGIAIKERRAIVKELHGKYVRMTKTQKRKLLDQIVAVQGYNRNYAARLLRCGHRARRRARTGQGQRYGAAVHAALVVVWRIYDCICGKRMAPQIGEMVRTLIRCGELLCVPRVATQLSHMSAATIDRQLQPERKSMAQLCRSRTRPGLLLKHQVPTRTYDQWREAGVGEVAVDCVGHDGGSTRGEYNQTVTVTDVATTWTMIRAVRNKAQVWVKAALARMRSQFPFPWRSMHSDSGAEFINAHLLRYTRATGIGFTRSRANKKNDNAYVEQKNNSVARRYVGYSRYTGDADCALLNQLYEVLNVYVNFFLPSMKCIAKTRVGGKVRRRYDKACTPYQRVLASTAVAEDIKQQLRATYATLNPAELMRAIMRLQLRLFKRTEKNNVQAGYQHAA